MNRTLFKSICAALCLALVLALPGCGMLSEEELGELAESPPPAFVGQGTGQVIADTYKADHVFSINSVEDESFNPYRTTSTWNLVAGMLAYEPLVKTDATMTAQPNLITSWETEDGREWTFYVDNSRSFHDGGTMTAADAVYTIRQAIDAYGSRYARRFAHVDEVDYAWDSKDKFTVSLDQANWRFYELLNIPCIESGSIYDDAPPGTGPYMFNEGRTALRLDPNYPGADKMPLKTIYLKKYTAAEDILQAFEDSLLDLVTNNPADAASLGYSSTNIIKYVETSNLHYIGYNMGSRFFSQAFFRSLVSYAVDRDTIVSNCFQGSAIPATLPIHPNSPLCPKTIANSLEYSPDNLNTVLTNLGGTDADNDGILEFGGTRADIVFLVCTDSTAKVAAARQIANHLRAAGFYVTMSELGYDDFVEALEDGDYDLYYGEIKLCNDWDLSPLLDLEAGSIRDPSLGGYMQTLLASDPATQSANAEALYQYIAQSAPLTCVCFERSQVLYHRGVLTAIEPTQENIFNNMADWQIDLD